MNREQAVRLEWRDPQLKQPLRETSEEKPFVFFDSVMRLTICNEPQAYPNDAIYALKKAQKVIDEVTPLLG